jgi:hypothetical protein
MKSAFNGVYFIAQWIKNQRAVYVCGDVLIATGLITRKTSVEQPSAQTP